MPAALDGVASPFGARRRSSAGAVDALTETARVRALTRRPTRELEGCVGGRARARKKARTFSELPAPTLAGKKKKKKTVRYTVNDTPPWAECALLGFQQYLVMLGGTTLMPFLVVPAMGGTQADLAKVISTLFFVSALNTLLQSTWGVRLPVFQGGSFAFIAPVLSLAMVILTL
jgi:hypothetical protein